MAITFKVGFQIDDKNLRQGLQGIQQDIKNAFNIKTGMSDEIAKATQQAMILEKAIKRATTNKGISYYSLNAELQKAGTSAAKLTATLAQGGQQFTASLNAANAALAQSDRTLISLNAKIKEMSRVMVQSFKFTAAQTTLQAISNAARDAYQWVYDLDKTVTNIGVVTGYTGDQLEKVTQNAIAGAKELRIAANDYAEGALIFYQQGLGDDEVARRVEITAKAARAAGSSLEAMSSQLTAIWNTYKMTGDEMQRAASVGAKMAGDTAVDFSDIAEAMQTAAAPAEQMGVSYNSLAAIISTVGDTTQQSASVIGNAFKTIFSRFQQLKSEGTDGEVTLNRVSSQLQELGVNVLDSAGNLRNLDSVIAEVGDQWDSWSSKQQLAIAQLVGGTRQYGQFLTLMNNFDKYQELLNSANLEDGSALEQQYQSSLDSIESHAENAGEAWRRAFGSLIDEDTVKGILSAVEEVGNGLDYIFSILGDAKGVALYIATIFSKQWVPAITNAAKSLGTMAVNLTPKQREKNINREYDNNAAELDTRMASTHSADEQRSLQLQKQKNEYGRQTAIINDKINTSLKTANATQKIILDQQRTSLKIAQERYQNGLDRLNTLSQEADKMKNLITLEEQQAIAEERKAKAILAGYQAKLKEIQESEDYVTDDEYNAAMGMATEPEGKYTKEQMDEANATIEKYNQQLTKTEPLLKKIAQAQDRVFEASLIRESAHETTKLQQSFISAESAVAELGAGINNSEESLQKAREAVGKFKDQVKKTSLTSEKLKEQFDKIEIPEDATVEQLEEILQQLEDITEQANTATDAMRNMNAEGTDASEERNRGEEIRDTTGQDVERGPQGGEGPTVKPKIDVSGVIEGAAQASMAISSFGMIASSIFDTLTNDSASFGEKFLASISGIAMAIPMITQLNAGVMSLAKAFNIEAASQEKANAITLLATLGQKILNSIKEKGVKGTLASVGAIISETVANAAGAVGAGANAAAHFTLATAIKAVWKALGPIAIGFLAVAAAVAAVVAIVKGLIALFQFLTRDELAESLDSAKESAEMFATALEDAKTEAEELKSAFDSYESVKKTLDECAQGTEEWKDALRDVNNEVLSLMEQYPELSSMVNEAGEKAITRDENTGELQVADWAMEQMENEANQKVQNTQAASIHANQNVREAEIDIAKREAGMSGASDAVLDVLANNQHLFDLEGQELVTALQAAFDAAGVNASAAIYASAIENNTEAARALAQQVQANTVATETENDILGQAALEGTDYEGTDLAMGQAGTQYQAAYDKAYQDAYDKITDRGAFNTGTETSKEIFQQYADARGLSDLDDFEVTNYRGDGDVDIKYTDENGDEQKETIKAEDVANFIAGAEAAKNLGTNMEVLDTDVQSLSKGVNDATQANEAAAKAIEDGNVGSLTKEEFDDLKAKATSGADMSTYLQSQGMSKENADIYGQMLYDQLNQIDWDDALKGIEIPDSALDNFTTAQAQKLGNAYEKIGEIGGEEMQGQIEDIISAADEKGMGDEVAAKLAEVDFTDWDSIEEFQDYLNSIGLDFDALGIDLDEFTEQLQNADGVLKTVDPTAINEKYQEIFDFAKDLDIGDTITEEQFLKLDENMQGFFQDMGDGTYQLTQDAETFLNTVKEAQLNDLMNEAEKAQQNYDSAKAASYDTPEDKNAAMESATQSMITTQTAVLGMASTLAEFDAIYAQLAETMGEAGVQLQAKATALTQLASQFDNTTDEVEAYNLAVQNLAQYNNEANREALALAEGNLRVATTLGEAAQKYDLNAEVLETQTREIANAKGISEEAAATMAVANQRLNKGIQELSENWKDWSKVLKSSDKTTQDYAEALTDLSDAVTEIVGWYEDLNLTSEFVEENMDLIGEAAEGNSTAILQLGAAVAETQVKEADLDQSMVSSANWWQARRETLNGTANAFEQLWQSMATGTTMAEAFASVQSNVAAGFNTISASMTALQNGASLSEVMGGPEDLANWVANLNAYASATQMTAQEMNQMLGSVGVTAKVTTEYEKQTVEVPTYVEHVVPLEPVEVPQGLMSDGEEPKYATYTPVKKYTVPGEPFKTEGYVGVAKIESITPDGGGTAVPDIQFTGKLPPTPSSTGGNTGGNGGGGGSAPKHSAKKAKKRESIKVDDRYSTVKASIDDVQREMDKFSANQDDMWGGAKLNALKKYNKELRRQAGYYRELLDSARDYLDQDMEAQVEARKEAEKALGASLIQAQQNDDGYIKNRTEIINQLDDLLQAKYDEYKAAADAFDADKSTDEARSEQIDKLKEEYDDLEQVVNDYIASLDQVDDTAKEAEEALQKLVEAIREEIANKVEEITYKIELQVEINDLELEQIERTIEHLGDVGVLTGKKFGLLSQSFRESQESANLAVQGIRQLEGMINSLNTAAGQEQFIKTYGQEAWDEYAASGVLPEEAIDGIKDYISDLTSAIDDMYSKMEDMFDTYLDLLDMYIEKFDQIADKISRNSDKLDTYERLLEFSGQQWTSEGQTARNTIAEARVSTAQANITLAQSKFETTKGQYDEWMEYVDEFQREHGKDIENYDEATAAAWNKIEETRKTLYDEMTASEEEIYANMQDFVDSVADAIEVGAEVIKEQIADSLGGLFYDFDSMMENYDQMETLRLFFLEDYDKNYQLESLLRDIDDAMADVTDPGRLEEYNKLIDEVNASNAEGVQITQNDVDLLKAKFELQKAQDAYEEAQNAKNTMRLARDASGNWNYVYSQDQSQSEDAAQALADAQYNYDKLLHEVRDESSQLWLQTQQEFYQWQSEIDQSRLQWDLEYRQSVEQTTAYYLEMTQRYADQVEKYNGLLGESYSETTLGVVTNFGEMQDAQDFYTQKHQEYNAKLEENTKKWEGVMDEECEKVGLDYTQLAKDVTSEATKIMNENSQLESDVQNLQQVASKALTSMSKNVQSNVNSMISAIQRLEAELRRAIQLLETLTNKSLMSGYDENTDYTDYLHTDYAAYQAAGGKMEMSEWLDMYHSQDIWERMGAGADRGIYSGKEYDEAKDLIIDSYNPDATYINGDQYNFGEGTSGKYLNDWSNIKDQEADLDYNNLKDVIVKGKRANGGIVDEHGLYELAENGTEFVLNPDDTKNILAAVSQMREVVKMKMQGLNGNLSKQTAGVTEKTVIDRDVQQVEQAVHIDATFPNVSVAKEIEEAFSNLVNQAVQYASAQKNSRQG